MVDRQKEMSDNLFKQKKKLEVLGVNLENYPALYQWALVNPEGLKASIEGMMQKQGFSNPEEAMTLLESDMAHLTNSTEE